MDPNNDSNRNSELEKRSFSQLADEIDHEPDEYHFFKMNEPFSNSYVDNYIISLLENEFIPDILMDVICEMTDKTKIYNSKDYNIPLKSDIFIQNTSKQDAFSLNQMRYHGSHLLSDNILSSLNGFDNKYSYNISKNYHVSSLPNSRRVSNTNKNNLLISSADNKRLEPLYHHNQSYANANSASIFDFEPSHTTEKSIRKEISEELKEIEHSRNNVTSTQNYVTENFISTTLQSDILRKLVNETLEEERKSEDIDQFDLKIVHNIIYNNSEDIKKSELEDESLNIDFEKDYNVMMSNKTTTQNQSPEEDIQKITTPELFNLEFLDDNK